MSWPPHHIDTLKRLWPTRSAAEIAATLGTVSRSAVIGMAHRLKLGAKRALPRPHVVRAVRTTPFRKPRSLPVQPLVRRSLGEGGAPPLPPANPVTLAELTHKTCRYPIGDRVPYLYCGSTPLETSAYCAQHHGINYYPPRPR